MQPDAEPHLLTGRSIRILFGYGVLHLNSTLHGIHGAGEIGDEAIPSRVEDPTPMSSDQPIDDDPIRGEGAKGADLISPHETAIALDIGGEDRSKLSFDGVRFQAIGTSPVKYSPTGREIRGSVNHSEPR